MYDYDIMQNYYSLLFDGSFFVSLIMICLMSAAIGAWYRWQKENGERMIYLFWACRFGAIISFLVVAYELLGIYLSHPGASLVGLMSIKATSTMLLCFGGIYVFACVAEKKLWNPADIFKNPDEKAVKK